jgi:polysaccharide deacetylase 2 family uncharacterized protein YibQ
VQYRAKNNILIGITLLCMVTIVAFGYLMEEEPISGQSLIAQTYTMDERKINELPKTDVEEIRIEQIYPCVDQNIVQEEVLENTQGVAEPSVEQNTTSAFPTKSIKISHQGDAEAPTTQKPKLVIIIDDVTTPKELHAIEALGIKITPSIFPPSERSMKSHLLAKGLNHFMIHLPMESGSKQFNTQYKTLFTTDSEAKIQERVKEIRQLFPTGHYINNHTGSVFTANFDAMMGLYKALREEGFIFVDSLTIGTSKVKKVMNVFGDDYIARDVFIDNEHTISYIHHQLQIAVEDAKRKGYAIAIGHPHCTTLEALAQATDILAEVELVYIDALYK